MSNKKRRNQAKESAIIGLKLSELVDRQADISTSQSSKTNWLIYLKTHWWLVGIIAFLSLGALGAGLRYLEKDAKRQNANQANLVSKQANQSWLNRINPFISAPLPTSTPQLAREYLYAGSRLLAVEDANASALPTPCTPAATVTEGDLAPGGIVSFGVSSGANSVTVDHVNGGTGLQSFTLVSATNATVNLQTFTPGTYNPTTATFTVPDPSQPVDFRLRAASAFHAIFVRVRCF